MRFAVDFDDIGRNQQRVDRAPPGPKLALDLAQRTIALRSAQNFARSSGLTHKPSSQ